MITEKDTIQDIDIIIDFADFGAEEKIKMIKNKLAQYWQQNPVDDGQEGMGLKFIEWEYKVRPSLVDWDLTDMGKQGWQLCAVNDKYYYFKRPLPEPHKP